MKIRDITPAIIDEAVEAFCKETRRDDLAEHATATVSKSPEAMEFVSISMAQLAGLYTPERVAAHLLTMLSVGIQIGAKIRSGE